MSKSLLIIDDILSIFSENHSYITKNECKKILELIFKSLFNNENIENFDKIWNKLSNMDTNVLYKEELLPIAEAFIVCFDVLLIKNSNNFNPKNEIICIEMKNMLPFHFELKQRID